MNIVTPHLVSLAHNLFCLTLAAMGVTTAFLCLDCSQVAPAYRNVMAMIAMVTAISAYRYLRIFKSWNADLTLRNAVVMAAGFAFDDTDRYVDCLLTVRAVPLPQERIAAQ